MKLTDDERAELKAILAKGKRSARKLKRAQILLATDAGETDEAIAANVGTGTSTVFRIKRRFVEGNLERALEEEKRPGAQRKLTGQEVALLVATACAAPVDVHYPDAELIRVVLDNLSTHAPGALYEAFAPEEARRILRRIEFHFVPKHGSWLNMAEIEIGVLRGQCLDRRIEDAASLKAEIAAWEKARNDVKATIEWTFTTENAREKMGRAYPKPSLGADAPASHLTAPEPTAAEPIVASPTVETTAASPAAAPIVASPTVETTATSPAAEPTLALGRARQPPANHPRRAKAKKHTKRAPTGPTARFKARPTLPKRRPERKTTKAKPKTTKAKPKKTEREAEPVRTSVRSY